MRTSMFLGLALLSTVSVASAATDDLCVFHEGVVVYETAADNVDSVVVSGGKVVLYGADKAALYAADQSYVDSIRFLEAVPQADLLDVKFNSDGSAEDVSPMRNKIETVGSPGVYMSSQYGRYVSKFKNPWSGTATDYYKISYAGNTAFMNALADGHSMETIVRASYGETLEDKEAKWFSSHQSGGTGFMISKKDASSGRGNEITFLPYVGGAWKWANSGVVPENEVYYHVVGVWNKEKGKAYIYVNGELKKTVDAQGDFKHAKAACYYFSIGADPSKESVANTAWTGDVAVVRIYDAPLTQEQVAALWKRVSDLRGKEEATMVKNLQYFSNLKAKAGKGYYIYGNGFAAGDKIVFTDKADAENTFVAECVLDAEDGVKITLPENIVSGTYKMTLMRDKSTQFLGENVIQVVDELPNGGKVIAHRGHWNVSGAAQNSRKSLQNALDLNCYGSETDVWLTTDGHIVVNHDATLNGVTIQTSTYDEVKDLQLGNGETIPELKDFLDMLAKSEADTKLIIEIKSHSTVARTCVAADSVVALVQRMGLQSRVEYIAFSIDACQKIVAKDPSAIVGYLNGDKTPQQLFDMGIKVLDYKPAKVADSYIPQAHALGMFVNVWTVDAESSMVEESNRNVDFISTNDPVLAGRIYRHYTENK